MRRPDYIQRKIDLRRQQAEHRATAPAGCRCALCLPPGRITETIYARNEAERDARPEAPF